MELDALIKGLIEKVNDLEQIQIKQWKVIDNLQKQINMLNERN